MSLSWNTVKRKINDCRDCEQRNVRYLVVPTEPKPQPQFPPPQPTRLLFVSIAPPWGGSYFWDDTRTDNLRNGLFKALDQAGFSVATLDEFLEHGFFMVPGVKCPSCDENGKDRLPSASAIKNCAGFLREQCQIIAPERILALGLEAMKSLSGAFTLERSGRVKEYRTNTRWLSLGNRRVPLSGTYFPGTDRHGGGAAIVADIRRSLRQASRTGRVPS